MFVRILKDAHDEGIIDLRRRGDDFEVARAAEAAPVSEQLTRTEDAARAAAVPSPGVVGAPTPPRIGMRPRGGGPRVGGRPTAPPPELLSIGVVEQPAAPRPLELGPAAPALTSDNGAAPPEGRGARRGRGRAKKAAPPTESGAAAEESATSVEASAAAPTATPKAKRTRRGGAKRTAAKRAKKAGAGGALRE